MVTQVRHLLKKVIFQTRKWIILIEKETIENEQHI